jgi:hypothetical protein
MSDEWTLKGYWRLDEPFSLKRNLIKANLSFVGLLTLIALIAEWSEEVNEAKQLVFKSSAALVFIWTAFLLLSLLAELVVRYFRLQLEDMRSDPGRNRRGRP